MDEVRKMSREIDYSKLIYHFKTSSITPINFIKFKGPFSISKEIRDSDKTLQEREEDQKKLKSSLGEITSGNPKHKGVYQLDTIESAKNLYDSRQKVIDLSNDNSRIKSEVNYKPKLNETEQGGTGLKILTPKQLLQRLPIAFAQLKVGNNSEYLLNEISRPSYLGWRTANFARTSSLAEQQFAGGLKCHDFTST